MPNHMGAFLKASKCFAELGSNITHAITEQTEIVLIEPACGSNTAIIKNDGRLLFVDSGYACYREEKL